MTTYNLLNLPKQVQLTAGRSIKNTYSATGRKLKTEATDNGQHTDGTKTYNGNLVFDKNRDLEYILFDEGRIVNNNGVFEHEYHLKDHLGSTRVAFIPNGMTTTVVQENSYYPFGSKIDALSFNNPNYNNRAVKGRKNKTKRRCGQNCCYLWL
jgi:hypothetical protein